MNGEGAVELARPCRVTLVPSGEPAVLAEGEPVVVVQELGGSFTVALRRGQLARIDGSDADALGVDLPSTASAGPPAVDAPFDLPQVLERLRTVYDPEIPVNVVDLGLVYRCEAEQLADGTHRVEIDLSMTAPGCGMGDVLREEASAKVAELPGVSAVFVELVWDPPWDLSRMSEEARLELGLW